jgi:hypothetical protein
VSGKNAKELTVNKVRILFISLIATMVALFLSCSRSSPVAGGSSQQGNGIVMGRVVDASGNSIARARVALLPALYDPVKDSSSSDSLIDTADDDGRYSIAGVGAGDYTIVAVQGLTGLKALKTGITLARAETVLVSEAVLRKTGCIKVKFPDTIATVSGYVYLPGTTVFAFLKNRMDTVILDSVPAGRIPELSYSSTNSTAVNAIRYNIPVASGDTAFVRNTSWKYARSLGLNTSATGAGVFAAVVHFPVLIRLTAGNFNFSQAKPGGADLMFTKSNNTALPYEIERWDPIAALAEIWVKVDTIFGNDSNQSITMYWGASTMVSTGSPPDSATSLSNGAAVFDTADGFQGVWHLGDAAQDSVRDATINQYSGASPDTARPQITEGRIGNCRKFDGKADYITMPNTADGKLDFPQNGKYSVSAWVMADTFTDLQQTLVSKGKYQYFLWMDSTTWQFWEFQNRTGWESSARSATLKQWVLLTGVRDGTAQYLYVNGEPVDSFSLKPDISPRNTASDLFLGRSHEFTALSNSNMGFSNFMGKIDEVRILSAAQSPDWVRLCYMNQRDDDRLVINKK